MADITKYWEKKKGTSLSNRFADSIKKPGPLRDRVSYTIYRLKLQQNRLERSYANMQNHYNDLFRKCTGAVVAKDNVRASIYANECAELKKMSQTILRSQFAIEQVILRLETVEEFGDIVVDISPIAGVINSVRGHLAGVVPEVSYKLGEIGDTLNDLVMEAGGATAHSWNVTSSGEEAERILMEANTIAEQKMKDRFPTLPTTLPSLEETQGVDFK